MTWAARCAGLCISGYQLLVSPALPRVCRFEPSCSEYARQAVIHRGLICGLWLVAKRLVRCHPLHPGGYDPPPIPAS